MRFNGFIDPAAFFVSLIKGRTTITAPINHLLALVGVGLRHSRRRLKRAMPTDARGRCPQKIKKVMVTMKVSSLSLSLSSLTTMKVSSLSLFHVTVKVSSLSLSLFSLTTMKVSSLSLFPLTVKVSS